jgi:hypothetical protein
MNKPKNAKSTPFTTRDTTLFPQGTTLIARDLFGVVRATSLFCEFAGLQLFGLFPVVIKVG